MARPELRVPSGPPAERLLDAVAIAVIVTDSAGIVTDWNESAHRLFGWSATEASGRPVTDLTIPIGGTDGASKIVTSVAAGIEWSGELECHRRSGGPIWTFTTLSPIIANGRVVGIVCSSVDVTERRATAIRITSLLQRSSDVALIVGVDATLEYISPSVERSFGHAPGALAGTSSYDLVHPDDRTRFERAIAKAVADPASHPTLVYRARVGDGSWRWAELVATNLLDEPAVGGIVLNVRDVSEREEAFAEVLVSEARFRSLFEHANDVGFLADRDGRIRYVTPSVREVLGYEPEAVLGRAPWTTFGIKTIEPSTDEIQKALERPGSRVDYTAELHAADGSRRVVEVTARNLTDDPAVEGFVTNLRDVTDRMDALVAARASEARQRAIVAHSMDLTMFFEVDGTVAWASPNAIDVYGAVAEELIGHNGLDMIHPDDQERVFADFLTTPALGDHVRTQFRVVDPAGNIRWIDEVVTNLLDNPDVGYMVGNLRDITTERTATEALAASEARYRSIVETAQEGIWVTAVDGSTVFANPTMAEMLGTDVEALRTRPLESFFATDARQDTDALDFAGSDSSTRYEALLLRDDGDGLWAIVSTSPLQDASGEAVGVLHMVTDITNRKAMVDELSRLALHDALTGLPNRGLFVNRLEHCLSRESDQPAAVLYIDLDHFKDVNNSLGSTAGDETLIEIGARLRAAARPGDTVARVGGDEFVVLCEGVVDASEAVSIAEKLHTAVRWPLNIVASQVMVSASIGVALSPPAEGMAVMQRAGIAMHRAKEQGRGRITLFDEQTDEPAQERLHTQLELHRALENDELVVWYQPIVDLNRARVIAVEALVRWNHPTRGLIPPDDFIPVAEASGLIRDVGWRVLEVACRDVALWDVDHDPLGLSVNLAAAQLVDDGLLARVGDVLRNTGFSPQRLTMELTESVAMHDSGVSDRQLRALRELGISLALDDFGTGYSSLSMLRSIPVSAVKIDRSFVNGLGTNRDDTLIVGGVISMARAMGHAVVAEGIETEAQLEEVSRLGCQYGQGYLFSRAVPLDELAAAIAGIDSSFSRSARDPEPRQLPAR